jgi:hypothetical protein
MKEGQVVIFGKLRIPENPAGLLTSLAFSRGKKNEP